MASKGSGWIHADAAHLLGLDRDEANRLFAPDPDLDLDPTKGRWHYGAAPGTPGHVSPAHAAAALRAEMQRLAER